MSLEVTYAVTIDLQNLKDYVKHYYESLFSNNYLERGWFIRNYVAYMMNLTSE